MFAKLRYRHAIAAAALAAFAVSAPAQQRPGYGPSVTVDQAKKIAAKAIAECQSNKWNVAVSVVDTHGLLIYFERMEDTQVASSKISIMKAKAAATYRRPTRAFVDAIAQGGPATLSLPGVVASPGGIPLMVNGKVIGAIGVSGVTGDQDEQCSKAGAAAL
ncbi:MAG TPA: heme-binding protein [Burkholderiales bacterium]|nr:heme-binding protein [Burkholderiales bacterium]